MYRSALRSTPRATNALRQTAATLRTAAPRRLASTTPANKKRSWKGSFVRWGLAAGAVYYYSTSPAFAEEPQPTHVTAPAPFSDEDLPTVEAVVAQKRKEAEARLAKAEAAEKEKKPGDKAMTASSDIGAPPAADGAEAGEGAVGSPEDLEAEAGQQGAFNPETGEINWDCPCLGGMANGPCGEEFKAAFSCFVYSNEEPKGMDCIDKFQHMQDCFRLHPEVYGDELADDEESEAAVNGAPETANASVPADAKETSSAKEAPPRDNETTTSSSSTKEATPKTPSPFSEPEKDRAVPKAAWDATSENDTKKPTPDSKPKAETPKTEAFAAQPSAK
ncbi:mitochondrial intermembrane space import and assembly protein 40 protein [Apiospora aurea]|uniref:Mitochondrial intermembrane space import and assembly protein 40 n=1 Tax=Apiospora aurea TaxID=335848 RepID=A0ABR1QIT8_9PEZI